MLRKFHIVAVEIGEIVVRVVSHRSLERFKRNIFNRHVVAHTASVEIWYSERKVVELGARQKRYNFENREDEIAVQGCPEPYAACCFGIVGRGAENFVWTPFTL